MALRRSAPPGSSAAQYLTGAVLVGLVAGIGSMAIVPDGSADPGSAASKAAVSAGLVRTRAPQPGDAWRGCNDARAAGTAPIYLGEPGYREGMDGDGDGVACEPDRATW